MSQTYLDLCQIKKLSLNLFGYLYWSLKKRQYGMTALTLQKAITLLRVRETHDWLFSTKKIVQKFICLLLF